MILAIEAPLYEGDPRRLFSEPRVEGEEMNRADVAFGPCGGQLSRDETIGLRNAMARLQVAAP
jgi:hypothetical protein